MRGNTNLKIDTNTNANTNVPAGEKPVRVQTGASKPTGAWDKTKAYAKENPWKTGIGGASALGGLWALLGGKKDEPLPPPPPEQRKTGGGILAQATKPQEQPYDFQKDLDDIKDDMNKANRLLFASGLLGNTSMGKAAAAAAQLYGESSNSKRTALSKMAEIEAKKKDAVLEELKTRAEINNLNARSEQSRMLASKYKSELFTAPGSGQGAAQGNAYSDPNALSAQIPVIED